MKDSNHIYKASWGLRSRSDWVNSRLPQRSWPSSLRVLSVLGRRLPRTFRLEEPLEGRSRMSAFW